MALNRVRIISSENLVMNAVVALHGADGEWHDVRHAVENATVTLTAGEVSRAHLDLILVDAAVEAYRLDAETLGAFAHMLREHGWTVDGPICSCAGPMVNTNVDGNGGHSAGCPARGVAA